MGDSLVAAPSALDQTDLDTNILGVYRVRAYITDPRHCSRVRRLWTDDLDRDTLTTFGFEFARCTAEQLKAFVGRVEQRRNRRDIPRAEDGISFLVFTHAHRGLSFVQRPISSLPKLFQPFPEHRKARGILYRCIGFLYRGWRCFPWRCGGWFGLQFPEKSFSFFSPAKDWFDDTSFVSLYRVEPYRRRYAAGDISDWLPRENPVDDFLFLGMLIDQKRLSARGHYRNILPCFCRPENGAAISWRDWLERWASIRTVIPGEVAVPWGRLFAGKR